MIKQRDELLSALASAIKWYTQCIPINPDAPWDLIHHDTDTYKN